MLKAGGAILEASPRYQAAVLAQKAKERERKLERLAIASAQVKPMPDQNLLNMEEERQARAERLQKIADDMQAGEKLTAKQIIHAVAFEDGFTYDDLIGKERNFKVVASRHRAIMEVRLKHPHMSLPQIGRLFGGRDHTSVLSAIRNFGRKRYTGQNTRRAKEIDMDMAVTLRREGKTFRQIGDILGVNYKCLSYHFIKAGISS